MPMMSALLLAAQAAFVPNPFPTLPPAAGTEAYDAMRARQEASFRYECFSEPAIKLLLADWDASMAGALVHQQEWRAGEQEMAEAAYTEPFDQARVDRALRRQADQAIAGQKRRSDSLTAMLSGLSGEDKVRFARRQTLARPVVPAQTCGPAPR